MAVAAAARNGLFRRMFSTSSFMPPSPTVTRPLADPSTNLFVSGLNKSTTSDRLREAFAQFGEVVDARVVIDRMSGYSRGFGFVRYSTLEGSANGIKGMDGKFLDGWVIFAEYARPPRPPTQMQTPQSQTPYQRYE